MINNKTISLIIPCRNEEAGLKKIFQTLPREIDEVLVVDNQSVDQTAAVSRRHGFEPLTCQSLGYGHACMMGLKRAKGDIVCFLDGDGSYLPADLLRLIALMQKEKKDFVFGSRFPLQERSSMNSLNFLGNIFLTKIFNFLTFSCIKDSQSGIWAAKADRLRSLNLAGRGFSLPQEIKMEVCVNNKYSYIEAPVSYEKRLGQSKLTPWQDGISNLFNLFKKRISLKQL